MTFPRKSKLSIDFLKEMIAKFRTLKMKENKISKKISWRLILIHSVGSFFIILASRQFSVLNDIGILNSFDHNEPKEAIRQLATEDHFIERLAFFSYWTTISYLIGLLISFGASIYLTIKNKCFWLNSLLVLLIVIILGRLGVFDNKVVDLVFYSFGNLFLRFGLMTFYIANGLILLFAGLFFFFSKWTIRFAFNTKSN